MHSFLRHATNRIHRRIDQTSVLASLVVPGVTLDLYRIAMECLERAYTEIDRLLVQRGDLCPAGLAPYTPRVPSIHHDLVALNVACENPLPSRTPSGLKAPETAAAYLGMRYVVEGAQLGSRVIYGHLNVGFGEKMREIGSFWMPGLVGQSTWPDLLKKLAGMESRESLAAATRAARVTFRHMGLCLAVAGKELQ